MRCGQHWHREGKTWESRAAPGTCPATCLPLSHVQQGQSFELRGTAQSWPLTDLLTTRAFCPLSIEA